MDNPTFCLVHDTANIVGRYERIACFTVDNVRMLEISVIMLTALIIVGIAYLVVSNALLAHKVRKAQRLGFID